METSQHNPPAPGPLGRGLRAGALAGLVFGLADAVVATNLVWGEQPLSFVEVTGCVAASVLVYGIVYLGLGLVLGLGTAPVLRDPRRATVAVMALTLAAGLFLEVYWWTREHVYWGYSALSPERLGAAAAMAAGSLVLAFTLVILARRPLEIAARLAPALLVLLGLGGGAFLASEAALVSDRSQGAVNERNRDDPNVLLIVVDALRHDVIGAYGSERVQTPVLDRMAEEGTLFERAFVQAPFTWSSFGSILTGKYPRRHGMLKLQAGFSWVRHLNVTLPLHLKLAERRGADPRGGGRMQEDDWVAAAFMTGAVTRGSGLMAGVDLYSETLMGHELVHRSSRWSLFSSYLLLFNVWSKATQQIDYNKAGTTAVEWLTENAADRRFFAFLHLYSTHTPYDPEPRFRDLYVDPDYEGPIQAFTAAHRIAIEAGDYELTDADVQQIRDLYYGGTTQADHVIGEVLDVLREQGVLDDTIVVVTSDHGEELGEHGLWEHNWMYHTNLQVPLFIRWPEAFPGGTRVPSIVETVDLFPTICEVMGIELPPIPDDENGPYHHVDGVSLMPVVRGEAERVKDFAFAESGSSLAVHDETWKLVVSRDCLELEPGDPGWDEALRVPQLFHLANDPGETENLFERQPDQVVRLLGALRTWNDTLPIARNVVLESHRDQDAAAMLGDLGYLGDTGEDETQEP